MKIFTSIKDKWRSIKESERIMEEQRVRDAFYVSDCEVKNDNGTKDVCLCIMHGSVALQRYWDKDCHGAIIMDLQRYRRVAVEKLRAERERGK